MEWGKFAVLISKHNCHIILKALVILTVISDKAAHAHLKCAASNLYKLVLENISGAQRLSFQHRYCRNNT